MNNLKSLTGVCLLLWAAHCANGAIAYVSSADLGNVTATSLTASFTVSGGSNRGLAVCIIGDQSSDLFTAGTVTYNGVTVTQVDKLTPPGGGDRWLYMYYLVAPASGAHNLVVTPTGSSFIGAQIAEYTGTKQSAQPDSNTTNSATTVTTLNTTTTTVADNSWTVMCGGGYAGVAQAAGTGSTLRTQDATFNNLGLYDSNAPITPAGSKSMAWNFVGTPSADFSSILASFSPAVASVTQSGATIKGQPNQTFNFGSVTFANLANTLNTDGTPIYCSDCQVTSGSDNTCAASGSGAVASKINAVWRCLGASASPATFTSSTNCSSSASPAVCAAAPAGSIAIPTGVTSVALTVNTTAVTANSQIFVVPDDTLGTKLSVTCNSTLATLVGGMAITARTAGTSFQVTYNGTIATNPLCVSFLIIN